jgi:hypothetical protein
VQSPIGDGKSSDNGPRRANAILTNNHGDNVMPKIADYSIISDNEIVLTTGATGNLKEVTFNLDAPDPGSRAILMFNLMIVDPDDMSFYIAVNDTKVFSGTFNSNVLRVIHEVIPNNLLKTSGNRIQFKATSSLAGTAHFSDVVLFYQHTV